MLDETISIGDRCEPVTAQRALPVALQLPEDVHGLYDMMMLITEGLVEDRSSNSVIVSVALIPEVRINTVFRRSNVEQTLCNGLLNFLDADPICSWRPPGVLGRHHTT